MENNILNPELLWIDKRCYRINLPSENRKENIKINYEEDINELEFDDECLELEKIDGNKFQLKIHIPSQFHGQIIGQKGTAKKRLETETGCQLIVPKQGSRDSFVTIKGFARKNIISAKNRLDMIVIGGRSKQQFTHFLSVAFTSDELKDNFTKFKNEILNDPEIYGIDESLFQVPAKLHLTIATLALLDNEDRRIASELLSECKDFIFLQRDAPLKANLNGLNYMNDDPSSVNVIYGKVISDDLEEISNAIAQHFASHGYTQLKHDSVKLHVTLMNSLFRENDDAIEKNDVNLASKDDRDISKRITFDASKILKKYRDYNFGEITIKEIHLSQRYSKSTNGYYESTAILKIN